MEGQSVGVELGLRQRPKTVLLGDLLGPRWLAHGEGPGNLAGLPPPPMQGASALGTPPAPTAPATPASSILTAATARYSLSLAPS